MFIHSPETLSGKQFTVFRWPFFLLFLLIFPGTGLPGADEGFSVQFTPRKALFSGEINSEEAAQVLAKAVKLARPDIEIVNEGIHINDKASLPDLHDLKSILVEIGLSTHEGHFSINDDTITIAGLTDSLVVSTALMIRLRPIQGNRQIISHICIVPAEDLPDIPIILADGNTAETVIDFDPKPTPEDSFEVPGVLSSKLTALILFVSKQTSPDGKPALTAVPVTPVQRLRAVPVAMIPETDPGSDKSAITLSPVRTGPIYEELNPVLFSRNTFLLQANQEAVLEETVKLLQEARLTGKRIILRALKPKAGSATFNDWLCERRAEEAKTMLAERGIASGIITTEIVESQKTGDTGEVRLFVVIPPPAPQQVPTLDSPPEAEPPAEEKKTGNAPAE